MRAAVYALILALTMLLLVGACQKDDDPESDQHSSDDDDGSNIPPLDDDEDDDGGHWADDEDDDDSGDDTSDDDGDDDADDDSDDDSGDDDTASYVEGWAVGEAKTGNKAFAGIVGEDGITSVEVPEGGNVVLNGVDMWDADWGLAVGTNTNEEIGFLFRIQGGALSRIPINIPSLVGSWELTDVDVFDDHQAVITGSQTITAVGTVGIVLRFDNGVISRMNVPTVSANFGLTAVSWLNDSFGWAVGWNSGNGRGVILGWDGADWTAADYNISDTDLRWMDVDTMSNNRAFVVGRALPTGEINHRGVAMRYNNLTWTKAPSFPEDGQDWLMTNINGYAEDIAQTFCSKFDKVERWRYENNVWTRRSYGFELPAGGYLTGASLPNDKNGLVGFALPDDNEGLVIQWRREVWSTVEPFPDNMGRIRDVVTTAVH